MHQPQPGEPLTAREIRVLTMFGGGMTAKEIAWIVGRSVRTVEGILASCRAKRGVTTSRACLPADDEPLTP